MAAFPVLKTGAVAQYPLGFGVRVATQAVRFLDEAHRNRARYANLPDTIGPKTVAEAYDVQEALCAQWAARLGGEGQRSPAGCRSWRRQRQGRNWQGGREHRLTRPRGSRPRGAANERLTY